MKNLIKSALLALVSVFLITACDMEKNSDSSIKAGHAKVNFYLIDAPANYDEVWIEVLSVEVLMKGNNEDNGSAWINLPYESQDQKINLLSLTGGTSEYLGEMEIPAGEISQIRLILGDDNYIMQGGERLDLKTPSAQQSGLKLKVDKPLNEGISYDLVIDFDASRSIVKAGNSGQYILKPVLRVIAEESATIEGTVLPLEASPVAVSALIDEDSVGTFADENGKFVIRGLKGGNYTLIFTPNEGYQEKELKDIITELGKVTNIGSVELEEVVEEVPAESEEGE
ncbi:DUF4382 domain-containing protein [Shivajiella indica]|uniref:DUF4382 domain-containing protein n=1 Tax=Shivajiella indica TaxID=872115 RepID=A0ABW5B427_9BACT